MSDLVLPAVPAARGEAASGLAIRLFGPMEVRIGPDPLPRLRSRKGLWLLALLALRAGRPVDRDWPAPSGRRARKPVRGAASARAFTTCAWPWARLPGA